MVPGVIGSGFRVQGLGSSCSSRGGTTTQLGDIVSLVAGVYFYAQGVQKALQAFVTVNVAGSGGWPSKVSMRNSLNSLKGGLYRGLYRGLLYGLLRGILGG